LSSSPLVSSVVSGYRFTIHCNSEVKTFYFKSTSSPSSSENCSVYSFVFSKRAAHYELGELGEGNLQSYWTTTKLRKLTVVLDYYKAMETYSRIGLLRSYGNLQSYWTTTANLPDDISLCFTDNEIDDQKISVVQNENLVFTVRKPEVPPLVSSVVDIFTTRFECS
jgi:hypothetical protein